MGDLDENLFVLAIHARGRYHLAMHLAPAGDHAVLLELGDVTAAQLHAAAEYARSLTGVVKVVPGHSSLLVVWDDVEPSFDDWPELDGVARETKPARAIHVAFDGEDLDEFLASHALTRDAFLARVQTLTLTARYIGFRAGFAYLDGWPEEWAMPRRATSRPVQRGSFAIAGNVAGFYPIDSPGGWNVLGHTNEDLRIEPGEQLRVIPSEVEGPRAERKGVPPLTALGRDDTRFEIIQAPLVIATTTPFDDVLGGIATRAVAGNVTLLECPMSGPRIRFHRDVVVAWCDVELRVERVRAGEERAFGRVLGGLRGYLAIGEREGVLEAMPERSERRVIHAIRGPHDVGLDEIECEVTPQLNRVGVRLRPLRELRIDIPADLRSIGMQCGSVQLHPDGSLVAMGPDHPVTGGYLQPMTVITSERWKLAQLMPGERVTFKNVAPASSRPERGLPARDR
jgi:allophanate hydrolase subunit 1